jgi:hypothetical protein
MFLVLSRDFPRLATTMLRRFHSNTFEHRFRILRLLYATLKEDRGADVYRDIPADTRGTSFRLSAEYKAAARSAAEQQIVLAGARLANLINQALR